jgi:hypothetical protein
MTSARISGGRRYIGRVLLRAEPTCDKADRRTVWSSMGTGTRPFAT